MDDQRSPIFVPPVLSPAMRGPGDDAVASARRETRLAEAEAPRAERQTYAVGRVPETSIARREGVVVPAGPVAEARLAAPYPSDALDADEDAATVRHRRAFEDDREAADTAEAERARPLPVGRVAYPGETVEPVAQRQGRRRWLLWLLIAAVIVGVGVWLLTRHTGQPARNGRGAASDAPMPVGTAAVQKGDMPVTLSELGTVTPLATVTIKTQINGQLIEVAFQEGQMVNKGDFLAQIDPRPYQVALEQAEGQLAKDQAALRNAQLDLTRYRTLVAQNSIARQTLDTQAATVQQDVGAIQTDQAQVDAQKLNLVYCHIVSPVTGRVGLRQVDPGNYVQTSDANGLVVVTQVQPISAIFTIPEDNLQDVLKQVRAGATLQAVAYDRSGSTKLATGKLDTIDNQIDTSTGTVKLRALFDNADGALFANQFVNIQLVVSTLHDVPIVPTSAIERGAPGTFVYVVKPDQTVAVQKVTLGPTDGQRQAITQGLQPGQNVVTDGADRLKDGAKVTVSNAGAPPAGLPPNGSQEGTAAQGATQLGATPQSPTTPAPPAAGNPPAGTGATGAASGQDGSADTAQPGSHQHRHHRANGGDNSASGNGNGGSGSE